MNISFIRSMDLQAILLYHARLYREQTLAGGGTICDYWFVGDQEPEQMQRR